MYLKRKGRLAATVAAMSVVLTVGMTACSSDGDSSSSAPSADESSLGTPNKATGTPVTFGFISDGKTDVGDVTDEIKGAQAAVGYANEYLGGVNGHPIELKTCESKLTPAGGTDCANQMVQAKVAAVVEGINTSVDATIDTLMPAKIPLFMHGGSTAKSFISPGVYSFFSGVSAFGVAALQAKDAGVEKAAIITAAVPAAEGAARGVGQLVYGNAGVAVDIVPIALGTPDATPQITTAINDDAGAFLVLGSDAFCVSALKSVRTLAPDAPITIPDRCITEGASSSIPNGYKGISVATSGDYDPSTPDAQVFIAALAKFGNGADFGPTAGYGWQPTLALIQALNASKVTDLTPANVLAGVQSAPPLPFPLGAGITYQCDGKQMPISPYLCGSDGIVATAAQDGSLTDFRKVPIDPALFSPPSA